MEGAEGLPESDGEDEDGDEEPPTTSDMDDEERVAKESAFEHEHRGTAYLNQVRSPGDVISRAGDVSKTRLEDVFGGR